MTTYTREELEAMFADWLDAVSHPFKCLNLEYAASKVLREVDPDAWNEGFNCWMDDEDITELTDPDAPDVELYAYVRDIEDEYENNHSSAMATAEEYEEWRGDQLYDLQNDGY